MSWRDVACGQPVPGTGEENLWEDSATERGLVVNGGREGKVGRGRSSGREDREREG